MTAGGDADEHARSQRRILIGLIMLLLVVFLFTSGTARLANCVWSCAISAFLEDEVGRHRERVLFSAVGRLRDELRASQVRVAITPVSPHATGAPVRVLTASAYALAAASAASVPARIYRDDSRQVER